MLKAGQNERNSELEIDALRKVRDLLEPVPFVSIGVESKEPANTADRWRPDFVLDLKAGDDTWVLIGEVKSDVRSVRESLDRHGSEG